MTASARPADGGRQRCVDCGHPRKEHHEGDCWVPRCPCVVYVEPPARR